MTLRSGTEPQTIFVLSDVHYASPEERARGCTEFHAVANPFLRLFIKFYRRYFWRRDPYALNHLLDEFLTVAADADLVVANGDYSCDTAFIGVSDPAACQSARMCLNKLRDRFGTKFHAAFGDHELGKMSIFGGQGGMRLASWRSAQDELSLKPFWTLPIGDVLLIGVTSSLIALPVFEPDTLPSERAQWNQLREEHLQALRSTLQSLHSGQRVILFCHDPTALPFLWREELVRARIHQWEGTIIGHLHSPLILWKSRLLAGMPAIRSLGSSVQRMSSALHDARFWKPFRVRLCPSLGGIELLKDGGYGRIEIDPKAAQPVQIKMCALSQC